MRTWEDNFREAAEAKGRIEILVNMTRHKFGEASAAAMATVLGTVQSEETLDEVGVLLLTCGSGEALLARIRGL